VHKWKPGEATAELYIDSGNYSQSLGSHLSVNYFLILSREIDNGSSFQNLFKCKTVDEVQKQKNSECNILLQPSRIVSAFSSSDFQVWNWVWKMIYSVVERIGTTLATPNVCLLISCMILKQTWFVTFLVSYFIETIFCSSDQ